MKPKPLMIAYEIRNKITKKRYIGITRQRLSERWKQHIRAAYRVPLSSFSLPRAIRKYGPGSFSVRAIACAASYRELQAIERILIAQERTMLPFGYNHTVGGEGAVGVERDLVYRANISLAMKGVWTNMDPDKKASRVAKAGRKRALYVTTPEHCANLSRALKGKKKSPEHAAAIARSKIGNKNGLGHVHTPQQRARMSAAKMGHEVSDETRAKIAAKVKVTSAQMWENMSPERRAEIGRKISASTTGRRKSKEIRL